MARKRPVYYLCGICGAHHPWKVGRRLSRRRESLHLRKACCTARTVGTSIAWMNALRPTVFRIVALNTQLGFWRQRVDLTAAVCVRVLQQL